MQEIFNTKRDVAPLNYFNFRIDWDTIRCQVKNLKKKRYDDNIKKSWKITNDRIQNCGFNKFRRRKIKPIKIERRINYNVGNCRSKKCPVCKKIRKLLVM